MDIIQKMAEQKPTLVQRIRNWIKEIILSIKGVPQNKTLLNDLEYLEKRLGEVMHSANKLPSLSGRKEQYSLKNNSIDKYGFNADNVSRANKQGELINEYYDALTKSEWTTFYNEITNNGYLATAIVGTVAPIVVNDKLIVAERQYRGKDAHDYMVTDAYKLFAEDGDTYTLTLLQDALNKGEVNYDTQRIFSFVSRINRAYGRDELLTRYNRDNSRFDITLDNIKQGKGSQEIHTDSQKGIAGERVSLRDKSSVQENNGLSEDRADLEESAFSMPEDSVQHSINLLTRTMFNAEEYTNNLARVYNKKANNSTKLKTSTHILFCGWMFFS